MEEEERRVAKEDIIDLVTALYKTVIDYLDSSPLKRKHEVVIVALNTVTAGFLCSSKNDIDELETICAECARRMSGIVHRLRDKDGHG